MSVYSGYIIPQITSVKWALITKLERRGSKTMHTQVIRVGGGKLGLEPGWDYSHVSYIPSYCVALVQKSCMGFSQDIRWCPYNNDIIVCFYCNPH